MLVGAAATEQCLGEGSRLEALVKLGGLEAGFWAEKGLLAHSWASGEAHRCWVAPYSYMLVSPYLLAA